MLPKNDDANSELVQAIKTVATGWLDSLLLELKLSQINLASAMETKEYPLIVTRFKKSLIYRFLTRTHEEKEAYELLNGNRNNAAAKEIMSYQDTNGQTLLIRAINNGRFAFAKDLFTLGIETKTNGINDTYGQTALTYALQKKNFDLAKFMLSKNPDLDCGYGETSLIFCIKNMREHKKDGSRYPSYSICAEYEKFATELIKKTNINQQDNRGNSALIYALERGHNDLAKKLIENKATIDNRTLLSAIEGFKWQDSLEEVSNSLEMVSILIANKANISAKDNDGVTPLMFAAKTIFDANSQKVKPIIKHLLDNKAKINLKDNTGKTPLIYAAWYGNIEVVKSLIEQKADLNLTDNQGKSAIIWAENIGRGDIVDLIKKAIAENIRFMEERHRGGDPNAAVAAGRVAASTYVGIAERFGVDPNALTPTPPNDSKNPTPPDGAPNSVASHGAGAGPSAGPGHNSAGAGNNDYRRPGNS